MGDLKPEGSSTRDATSVSTVDLNVKTLDSRVYSLNVDKNIVVSAFKEKTASQCGISVGQQRLIFRGKVLKDDRPLSEYNVENGDTIHLVERQPPPPGSTSNSADTISANGRETNAGQLRNRTGQGTLNVGDLLEAFLPGLSQIIGAIFNSIGFGGLAGDMRPDVQTSDGNETEGSRGNAGSPNQARNPSVPIHGQTAPNAFQIPQGAANVLPTPNSPIPDSLDTLIGFMNRMELAFSQFENQPNQSPAASNDQPVTELPRNSGGLPTVEALSTVLQHAQRLLTCQVVLALSHAAARLDQDARSGDPAVRGQVQTESVRLGVAMQHVGALLLELGRTILTLRMGQSHAESFVNAGPAVYISPSGPNPIMVQPFPLQTSSLFGGSSNVPPNPMVTGPVGVGSGNLNIHIHTGQAHIVPVLATREHNIGERANRTESIELRGPDSAFVSSVIDQFRTSIMTLTGNNVRNDDTSDSDDDTSSYDTEYSGPPEEAALADGGIDDVD